MFTARYSVQSVALSGPELVNVSFNLVEGNGQSNLNLLVPIAEAHDYFPGDVYEMTLEKVEDSPAKPPVPVV